MEQMRQIHDMDLFDDQSVEVLGYEGTDGFNPEAVFGSSAVVQMDGDGVLDVEGLSDDAPFWVDTIDMPEVTSVTMLPDVPFQGDGDADLPISEVEVMAEPLDTPVVEGEPAEVAADPVVDETPVVDEPALTDMGDDGATPIDDAGDDATTLLADF